jgi:hypothetical protein
VLKARSGGHRRNIIIQLSASPAPLKLVGRLVGERLMDTYGIEKGFDMLEHRDLGLIEVFVINKFGPIMPHCP